MTEPTFREASTMEDAAGMNEELRKLVSARAMEYVTPHVNRMGENVQRVSNLVQLYLSSSTADPRVDATDILRSAVVFLHAAIEDFLRSFAAIYLPLAGEEVLNSIPLAGGSDGGRAEKFLLGKLTRHRGKTVDQLLHESVENHLERSNFNNSREIAALLRSMGIKSVEAESHFADLDTIMQRRHQIVHRADRVSSQDGTSVAPIEADQVVLWSVSAVNFMQHVLTALAIKEFTSPETLRKLQAGEL